MYMFLSVLQIQLMSSRGLLWADQAVDFNQHSCPSRLPMTPQDLWNCFKGRVSSSEHDWAAAMTKARADNPTRSIASQDNQEIQVYSDEACQGCG